jgi:surface antigen
MAKAETEIRQGRPFLTVSSLAVGVTAPQTPRPGALFSLKAAGGYALRAAVGCVGGAAALMTLASGVAHAGQPSEPTTTDATASGAPLAILVSANVDAAEDNDPPEALEAPKVMRVSARLQCVPYARDASGVSIRGNANTWWRQANGRYERAKTPDEGAVIVMRGYNNANRGHVAVVREVLSQRSILIDHANWLNSGEITVNVPVVDVSPNNDWSQVRVWHIPTQTWGVRVYTVQGFILPKDKDAPAGAGPSYIAR